MLRTYCCFLSVLLFATPICGYSSSLFINSIPYKADVYILSSPKNKSTNSQKIKIGTTPLKTTNFSKSTSIIIEKKGFVFSTNKIAPSTTLQKQEFVLTPISFNIQFPQQQGAFYVNKTPYTDLDGILSLPYGNYLIDFDRKNNLLSVQYSNPYLPSVAFFSTLTVLSSILMITGAILGDQNFKKYQQATSSDELINSLGATSMWDAVMWSGVGLTTGGLIGSAITGALYEKERKRIKRFNGLNKAEFTLDGFSDFQNIILMGTSNPARTITTINEFLKKYKSTGTRFITDAYLKRAGLYVLEDKLNLAEQDLKMLVREYPTPYVYEIANKMLGDLFFERKKYFQAYEYYKESVIISEIYNIVELEQDILDNLLLALENTKTQKSKQEYKKVFQEELLKVRGLSASQKAKYQEKINKY